MKEGKRKVIITMQESIYSLLAGDVLSFNQFRSVSQLYCFLHCWHFMQGSGPVSPVNPTRQAASELSVRL